MSRSTDHYIRRRLVSALTEAAIALCDAGRPVEATAAISAARKACTPRDRDLVELMDTVDTCGD